MPTEALAPTPHLDTKVVAEPKKDNNRTIDQLWGEFDADVKSHLSQRQQELQGVSTPDFDTIASQVAAVHKSSSSQEPADLTRVDELKLREMYQNWISEQSFLPEQLEKMVLEAITATLRDSQRMLELIDVKRKCETQLYVEIIPDPDLRNRIIELDQQTSKDISELEETFKSQHRAQVVNVCMTELILSSPDALIKTVDTNRLREVLLWYAMSKKPKTYNASFDLLPWNNSHLLSLTCVEPLPPNLSQLASGSNLLSWLITEQGLDHSHAMDIVQVIPEQKDVTLAETLLNNPELLLPLLRTVGGLGTNNPLPELWVQAGGFRATGKQLLEALRLNKNLNALILQPAFKQIDADIKPNIGYWQKATSGYSVIDKLIDFFQQNHISLSENDASELVAMTVAALDIPPQFDRYLSSSDSKPDWHRQHIARALASLHKLLPDFTGSFLTVSEKHSGSTVSTSVSFHYDRWERLQSQVRVRRQSAREVSDRLAGEPEVTPQSVYEVITPLLDQADALSLANSTVPSNKMDSVSDHTRFLARSRRNAYEKENLDQKLRLKHYDTYELRWPVQRLSDSLGCYIDIPDYSRVTYLEGAQDPPDLLSLAEFPLSKPQLQSLIQLADGGHHFVQQRFTDYVKMIGLTSTIQLITSRFNTALAACQVLLSDSRLESSYHMVKELETTLKQTQQVFNETISASALTDQSAPNSEVIVSQIRVRLRTHSPIQAGQQYIRLKLAQYYRDTFNPNSERFLTQTAIPPALVRRARVVDTNSFDATLDDLPPDIVPITSKYEVGGIYTVSGANGSGKSVGTTTELISHFQRNRREIVIARHVEAPVEAEVIYLVSPQSTAELSLFQASAKTLAELVAYIINDVAVNGPQPKLILTDEWGVGTDTLARVAILKSVQRILLQINPQLSFKNSTHEAWDHAASDVILDTTTNFPHAGEKQLQAINPSTRVPENNKISPSFAELALRYLDPETADSVAYIDALRSIGVNDLDLSAIPERPIALENQFDGFVSDIDLDRLGFTISEKDGQFAFLKSSLEKLGLGRVAYEQDFDAQAIRSFTRSFALTFRETVQLPELQYQDFVSTMRSKIETVNAASPETFLTTLENFSQHLDSIAALAKDRLSVTDSLLLIQKLNNPEKFTQGLQSLLVTATAQEKVILSQDIDRISGKIDVIRRELAQKVRKEVINSLLSQLIDVSSLEVAYEQGKILLDYRAFMDIYRIETSEEDAWPAPAIIFEYAINKARQSDYEPLRELLRHYPSGNSQVAEALTGNKSGLVTATEIQQSELIRSLNALQHPGHEASLKALLTTHLTDIERNCHNTLTLQAVLSEPEASTSLNHIVSQVKGTTLALGRRCLLENQAGVPWSEVVYTDESRHIQFSGATDLSVYEAIGSQDYVPQAFDTKLSQMPEAQVHVFSGPNAEGKTSVMTLAGQLPTWARGLMGVAPAESITMSRNDQVVISLNAFLDDPKKGLSGLTAQGADIVRLVDQVRYRHNKGQSTLVILDEIFIGTASEGQRNLTAVVLQQLADAGATILISSHDSELKQRVSDINAGRITAEKPKKPIGLTEHNVEKHVVSYDHRGDSLPYRIFEAELVKAEVSQEIRDIILTLSQHTERNLRLLHQRAESLDDVEKATEEKTDRSAESSVKPPDTTPTSAVQTTPAASSKSKGIRSFFSKGK